MTEAIAGAAIITALMAGLSFNSIKSWNKRDFAKAKLNFPLIIVFSALLGFGSSILAYHWSQALWPSLSVCVLAYLFLISSIPDLKIMLIPMEPSILAYWMPVPLIILFWPSIDIFGLIVAAIIIVLFFFTVYMGMMGFGDFRLLMVFASCLSWWAPPMAMIYILCGAAGIQILMLALARPLKLGKRKGINQSFAFKDDGTMFVKDIEVPAEELTTFRRRDMRRERGKVKLYLPFGPSLSFSAVVVALYFLYTQEGTFTFARTIFGATPFILQ